jgi:uncharacterized protein YqeY
VIEGIFDRINSTPPRNIHLDIFTFKLRTCIMGVEGGDMELKKRIDEDLKAAMLAKEAAIVTVLRGLKAAILDAEVAEGKREKGLTDKEVEAILAKEIKRRRDATQMYEANGRGDLVESEKFEQEILEKYFPEQVSEDVIKAKIDEVLMGLEGGEVANVGMVIGEVKMLLGNSADGATIAKLVKEAI